MAERIGGAGPAANCFTHLGSVSSAAFDMDGAPTIRPNIDAAFVYIEPDDTPENCIDAVKAHSEIIRIKSFFGTIEDFCNDEEPDFPDTPSPCNP